MPAVYLDWNSTAPLRNCARDAWLATQSRLPGNPSSVHTLGQQARHEWDRQMRQLAELLGCRPHEIVATSGGTESNALAIHAALADGGHALISAIEHSSVIRNVAAHASTIDRVGVDQDGRVDPEALAAACQPDTRLVCLQYANNELGTRQDLANCIAAIRSACAARILVDACQGVGKEACAFSDIAADFLSCSGHKFGAPRGTGLLLVRTGIPLPALLHGGRQQDDRRSGTEDLAGLSALTAALSQAVSEIDAQQQRQTALLHDCFARITQTLPETEWLARAAPRLACTLSLAHPGIDSEALVTRLDIAGFCVSRAM